jgi:hypothetical protein
MLFLFYTNTCNSLKEAPQYLKQKNEKLNYKTD